MVDYTTDAEVQLAAGKNYDSSMTSGQFDNLIEQAQGMVNAATRYKWDDVYSTLGDEVKYLLAQATSAWAGMRLVAWNPFVYNSLDEAKFIADVCLTTYKESIKLLNDKVHTDWLKQQ